jgi:pteridine reductase
MKSRSHARAANRLAGKTIVVTGGAKRVGAAICRRLHDAGANLAIHYLTSSREARALWRRLQSARADSVHCVQADLLDPDAPRRIVGAALDRFGRIDGLVNNASSFFATPIAQCGLDAWHDLMSTNLRAPFFLAQEAQAELIRRKGAVVNIVDIHAERPLEGHLVYSMAKAGLVAFTRGLAAELGPHVRVNAVAPGAIAWPESGELAKPRVQAEILDRTPLKRIGSPDDIAGAVEFLLSGSPYVTGQILAVDGGRSVVM